jgi:hypothetical protein
MQWQFFLVCSDFGANFEVHSGRVRCDAKVFNQKCEFSLYRRRINEMQIYSDARLVPFCFQMRASGWKINDKVI